MAKREKVRAGAVKKTVADFVGSLGDDHRALILIKARLYGGMWEPMLEDLRGRLKAKLPFFVPAARIQDDINRIEQMRKFEAAHNIDLADVVGLEQ